MYEKEWNYVEPNSKLKLNPYEHKWEFVPKEENGIIDRYNNSHDREIILPETDD
jgi:hypothetical protein